MHTAGWVRQFVLVLMRYNFCAYFFVLVCYSLTRVNYGAAEKWIVSNFNKNVLFVSIDTYWVNKQNKKRMMMSFLFRMSCYCQYQTALSITVIWWNNFIGIYWFDGLLMDFGIFWAKSSLFISHLIMCYINLHLTWDLQLNTTKR